MPRLDLDNIESPVPAYATPRRAETKDASPRSSSRRRRHGVHRSRSASPPSSAAQSRGPAASPVRRSVTFRASMTTVHARSTWSQAVSW